MWCTCRIRRITEGGVTTEAVDRDSFWLARPLERVGDQTFEDGTVILGEIVLDEEGFVVVVIVRNLILVLDDDHPLRRVRLEFHVRMVEVGPSITNCRCYTVIKELVWSNGPLRDLRCSI